MEDNNPLRNFTIAGRLWIIACIVIGAGGYATYVCGVLPMLPPGDYPMLFFSIPVALATLVIYGIGYKLLQLCGVRLRIRKQ